MSKSRNSQIKQRYDYDPDSQRKNKPLIQEDRKSKRQQDRALRTKDLSIFFEDDEEDDWSFPSYSKR
jgi:hypothetical protein